MGTVAVVTGAASGVGAAVTQRLVDSDFQVWAADLVAPPQLVDPAADVHYVPIDVSSSVHVASFFEKLSSENSTPRVVVHAAGVDDPVAKAQVADATESSQPITVTAAMADEQWRRTISINLDGTFHILRAAVRSMWETGGAIVVIGSSAAFDCPVGYPHYSASKAGVHALCQSVAKEVIGRGIRVNVVAPGPTRTAMSRRTPATAQRDTANGHVLPHAQPDDIADSVLYLASDSARNISGATLLSNGGRFTR